VRELWLVDAGTPSMEQYVLEAGEWRTLGVARHEQPLRSVALPGFDAIPARVCAR
jgi:hypothetical protein